MRSGRNPNLRRPSFWRGPTALRGVNPESGTDRLVSSDLVEPKVVVAGISPKPSPLISS